ncbi:hypothetical protein DFP78_11387 [Photobacterium lutimaris]|nr:hypothetical protein DFP78_11387 [Photobacterium lutimaris]
MKIFGKNQLALLLTIFLSTSAAASVNQIRNNVVSQRTVIVDDTHRTVDIVTDSLMQSELSLQDDIKYTANSIDLNQSQISSNTNTISNFNSSTNSLNNTRTNHNQRITALENKPVEPPEVYRYLSYSSTSCATLVNHGDTTFNESLRPGQTCAASQANRVYNNSRWECGSQAGQPLFQFGRVQCAIIPQYMWVQISGTSICHHTNTTPPAVTANTACSASQVGTENRLSTGKLSCGNSDVHKYNKAQCQKQW